jgi:hypothetical protein
MDLFLPGTYFFSRSMNPCPRSRPCVSKRDYLRRKKPQYLFDTAVSFRALVQFRLALAFNHVRDRLDMEYLIA